MVRSRPESADAVGGKRSAIRSRELRWREGRYGKRRRVRPQRRPAAPRPVRDAVVAVAAGLVAAGVALSIAFGLLGAYRMPLHYGYGLVLGIIVGGGALAGASRSHRLDDHGGDRSRLAAGDRLPLFRARPDPPPPRRASWKGHRRLRTGTGLSAGRGQHRRAFRGLAGFSAGGRREPSGAARRKGGSFHTSIRVC